MKNKIFDNFALKVLAVILAVLLWLVVLNISDYTITVEIKDIPVKPLNGEALESLDQIYDIEKGETVDILVKGRRSVVDRLTAADFVATADLSTMSITNTVQIFVEPKNANLKASITCVDNTMKVNIEEKVSVQFPVRVNVIGTTKDGYANVSTVVTPNIITVTGPKSTLGRVTDVVVDVDIAGRSDTFESHGALYLVDAYGELFENEKVEIDVQSVDVTALIYPTKTVNLSVMATGKPEEGFAVSEISYQPQTITIAGLPEATSKFGEIRITDISVSGQKEDLQKTLDINNYLPQGVYLAQANSELAVNISIEPLQHKVISMSSRDLNMINKQSGCTYAASLSEDFKLTVTGLAKDIGSITIDDIYPEIDCSTLVNGDNHEVAVEFKTIDGVTYTMNGSINIFVKSVKGM